MNSYKEHDKVIIIYSFIKNTTSSLHQEIKFTSCNLNNNKKTISDKIKNHLKQNICLNLMNEFFF